jgi:hypothetical protein
MKNIIQTTTIKTTDENGNKITSFIIFSKPDEKNKDLFKIEIFDSSLRYYTSTNKNNSASKVFEYYNNLILNNELKIYYENSIEIDPRGYDEIDIVVIKLDKPDSQWFIRQNFISNTFDYFEYFKFEVIKLKNKDKVNLEDFEELENKIELFKKIKNITF